MSQIKRKQEVLLNSRIGQDKPLIQVLIGPRQVGKSTIVKAVLAGRGVYESADSPTPLSYNDIEEFWQRATASSDKILAIDELQKIEGWAEIIKKKWDQNPFELKVILTGSAALAIEKGLKESLAGRYELIYCPHWSLTEATSAFEMTLNDYIEFGCYPGSITMMDDVSRWAQYIRDSIVEPAIGRDILQLHPVENPALLRQVFGVALSRPAQIVSLNKMQGLLSDKGALATVQHYLQLLEKGFLISLIEKYSPDRLRLKKSPPKIIINDNGLMRAFLRPVSAPLPSELFGRFFENCVGARLKDKGWEIYYWVDRDLEVDLIGFGPNGEKYAIEVKTSVIDEKNLKGLKTFTAKYREFTPCLVSLVDQVVPGIQSLSAKDVLA
ncbi:MAG: hypothetical protein RJB66_2740 [Pseudomonadota bacterium]|jgi:predicted AAA+ superfamily ATPase